MSILINRLITKLADVHLRGERIYGSVNLCKHERRNFFPLITGMNSMKLVTRGESSASNFDLYKAATPEFVNLDQRKYYCIKCKKLLRNPQQIKCGHRICQVCFKASFAEVQTPPAGSEKKKICCPGSDDEACEEINEDEVVPYWE